MRGSCRSARSVAGAANANARSVERVRIENLILTWKISYLVGISGSVRSQEVVGSKQEPVRRLLSSIYMPAFSRTSISFSKDRSPGFRLTHSLFTDVMLPAGV